MKTFSYTIQNPVGIHARPARRLVKLAQQFSSSITIEKGGKSAQTDKLLMLMGLGISHGDTATVTVTGTDETVAAAQVEQFFRENL